MRGIEMLDNSSANEILDFVCSIVGCSAADLEKEYNESEKMEKVHNRQIKLHFEIGTVICIANAFNVCDICVIEFHNLRDSSACYDLCNSRFRSVDMHLWFDNDTLIQFFTNKAGIRSFRFCIKPMTRKVRVYI